MAAKMGSKGKRRVWAALEAQGRASNCHYCGAEIHRGLPDKHPNLATLDHATPRRRGGTNAIPNLVAACFLCNQNKGDDAHPAIIVRGRERGWSPFWNLKQIMAPSPPC